MRNALLAGILLCSIAACPYDRQVAEQLAKLSATTEGSRVRAAEALGFLRAYRAAPALAKALGDESPVVRRTAALALGWCGGRAEVPALLAKLDDADWTVRQAAWVALTNITGMEWPLESQRWREWWARVPSDRAPREVFELVRASAPVRDWASGASVTASSTYKGPPSVLTDGDAATFWQTKQVKFPQFCTVDLGAAEKIGCVVVEQYGPGYCMADFSVSVSSDGRNFDEVVRRRDEGTPKLVVTFPPREGRYVRITAYAGENPKYPTTFREVSVFAEAPVEARAEHWEVERGVRALGALGGAGATEAILKVLRPYRQRGAVPAGEASLVQVGLRSLGRLRDPAALPVLLAFLDNVQWARYAAEALGDFGGERAAEALVAAYPLYAKDLAGKEPVRVPADDRAGFESLDRMHETTFQIAAALARFEWHGHPARESGAEPMGKMPMPLAALRKIAPLILANLPSDFDGAVLYEPEACQLITAHLLAEAGMREAARSTALAQFGVAAPFTGARADAGIKPAATELDTLAKRRSGDIPLAANWLPMLGAVPELLEHTNGWVRLNAAKAMMFAGGIVTDSAPRGAERVNVPSAQTVDRIAEILARSKTEAEYGYFGGFMFTKGPQGHDEYNDPPPRWREAFVRALGRLKAARHVGLLAKLLKDDRNALEIHYSAALALDEIGTSEAVTVLREVEATHPFHSVRLVAREALWKRGVPVMAAGESPRPFAKRGEGQGEGIVSRSQPAPSPQSSPPHGGGEEAGRGIVFIKGPNRMPNRFQIDPWRQTYSTTDSGPTYRLGWNLFVLRDGKATALTSFKDGWVADCEVSADAGRVIFARRGGEGDPWWHVWEINADGTGLRQLTRGPYHDVQPNYLPDGRIVFSSTRIGMRDEYHGYPATGLTVMNADGSDLHCIGFNLGRDNEPAVLPDGRIVFSRLDLFYSRLKTELTVQAVFPDGTKNVTLYGPERRPFWRDITRQSGEKWWGEAPMRHRVLRLTQPEAWGDGRVLCATTGGLTLVGPGRYQETILPHDKALAVTSPFPLSDDRAINKERSSGSYGLRILCAAVEKRLSQEEGNLGLYEMELSGTGILPVVRKSATPLGLEAQATQVRMKLLYRDPAAASFEARPLVARKAAPVLYDEPQARGRAYAAQVFCRSAFNSQLPVVTSRGRLVRVIEGMPITGRHHTHLSPGTQAWKNHVGTEARVLGTVPLAADGSFLLEVPADRLIHLQVLDSDRRVVGNQQFWMYARPGEKRSCVGCHELPDTAMRTGNSGFAVAATMPVVSVLPTGGEFTYRAKAWQKGELRDVTEERTRTAGVVNLFGRQ